MLRRDGGRYRKITASEALAMETFYNLMASFPQIRFTLSEINREDTVQTGDTVRRTIQFSSGRVGQNQPIRTVNIALRQPNSGLWRIDTIEYHLQHKSGRADRISFDICYEGEVLVPINLSSHDAEKLRVIRLFSTPEERDIKTKAYLASLPLWEAVPA